VRVLVIQTAFAGDVLLTVPLLRALAGLSDAESVTAVVTPAGRDVLGTQRLGADVIVYDKRGEDGGAAGFARVAAAARAAEPDVAVVPHRSFRSALLAFLSGAPQRVGFDVSGGRAFLTRTIPYPTDIHELERVARLAEPLGWTPPPGRLPFSLDVPDEAAASLAERLGREGLGADHRVVVGAAGSRWATKRWPSGRFAEALDELSRRLDAVTVLTGLAADREASAAVARAAAGRTLDLTGLLTTGEWIALIARAALLVSNDSAALHVAAGVGTPVVAVFGPTVPSQGYGPYAGSGRVAEAPLACRPCGSHGSERCPLGTHQCMLEVGAPTVVRLGLEAVEAGAAP
jgi:heptosyltransferase-2